MFHRKRKIEQTPESQRAAIRELQFRIVKYCRDVLPPSDEVELFLSPSRLSLRAGIRSPRGKRAFTDLTAKLFPKFQPFLFWQDGATLWATIGFREDADSPPNSKTLYDHRGMVFLVA
jgi:hypothetical protein